MLGINFRNFKKTGLYRIKVHTILKDPNFRFFLTLLLFHAAIRLFFGIYNADMMGNWNINSFPVFLSLMKWSLYYDLLVLSFINAPFYVFLSLINTITVKTSVLNILIIIAVAILNTIAISLSLFDAFYFRFHLQRADADLLYVIFNPFTKGGYLAYLYLFIALAVMLIIFFCLFRPYKKMSFQKIPAASFWSLSFLFLCITVLTAVFNKKQIHPNYPLTRIHHLQLPLVQNSTHCFLYSLYRKEAIFFNNNKSLKGYGQRNFLPIKKKNRITSPVPRNLVLFIMESVPYDYFNQESPDHIYLPFLDSLRENSIQFNKAYSFSYNSNKGITALLAGLPTATEIPIYHSSFTMIPHTGIGTALRNSGYHSSFFIGDDYDDFGFAKCCNWLGIDKYYCRQDISDKKNISNHTFGLHDEVVLEFTLNKLNNTPPPFLAIQYNISTHFPFDIPASFTIPDFASGLSKPKRAMIYYDHCLQKFFAEARKKSWFNNTVFLFCSDHSRKFRESYRPFDPEGSFHIPFFIFDPQASQKKIYTSPVSQFDLLNTMMAYASYKDSLISYGDNLMEMPEDSTRVVFTKMNNAIYQAISSKYVLGYNVYEDKASYVYEYNADTARKNNLISQLQNSEIKHLQTQIQSFLKTIQAQYNSR